jgi:hypothetical protein
LVGVALTALFSLCLIYLGAKYEKVRPLILLGGALFVGNCAVTYNAFTGK